MRRDARDDGDGLLPRGDRPRTIAMGLDGRGQTTQDFAVGIGVFLLALAFVFSYAPSLTTPFDSSGGAETAQADRIADTMVENLSDSGTPTEFDAARFADRYELGDADNLTDDVGLRSSEDVVFDRVNVALEDFDGNPITESNNNGDKLVAGHEYDGQSGASAARIVTVADEDVDCDPACRLVVRVW